MTKIMDNLKYTKDHEWVRLEGDIAIEGITDYAQSELSDIVMVEPPKMGRKVQTGEAVGTIEAVKAVSDLYAALSGEVMAVNEAVVKDPALINQDPYNQGWLYKIKISNPGEFEGLLTPAQYQELVAGH